MHKFVIGALRVSKPLRSSIMLYTAYKRINVRGFVLKSLSILPPYLISMLK